MKKVTLMIAALALVLGFSQCKKENKPSANGEKQLIVLRPVWDNGDSKIAQDDTSFKWTDGDKIGMWKEGGTEAICYLDYQPDGTFKGEADPQSFTEGDEVIFKYGDLGNGYYTNQTGELSYAMRGLSSEKKPYREDGVYGDVTMTLPHALLKLDLSGFGTAKGNTVNITTGVTDVAAVTGVTGSSKNMYVAFFVAVDNVPSDYVFSCGTVKAEKKGWPLCKNVFYTGTDGAAIVIEPTAPTVPEGALNGLFTINEAGKKVYFSKGNLQYNTTSHEWRFADNQWNMCIGKDDMVSYDYGGSYYADVTADYAEGSGKWIDLFGWGSTGITPPSADSYYQHYQPWSTDNSSTGHSSSYNNYGYGPSTNREPESERNLLVSNGSDWGANSISNGGNVAGKWRTLTGGGSGEWDYLLNQRAMTNGKPRYTEKCVDENGTGGIAIGGETYSGLFIYPDDYDGTEVGEDETTDTWDKINALGIVFLPAAGFRRGTSVLQAGFIGNYWSSSYRDSEGAYQLYFLFDYVNPNDISSRCLGISVRLVSEN